MFAIFLSSLLIGCGEDPPKQQSFDNLPPFSPIISMTPTDPYTTDDLVVGIITESTDPDGDSVTTGYVWTVDGAISDQTAETVPSSATTKGEVWTVSVISNDGSLDSAPATFSVTIRNTAPVIDGITATENPEAGDAISVSVDGVTDADGDDVELSYSWSVNGEGSSIDSGDVPADTTAVNDIWVLTITPNDGETDGEPVTATFDFSNAVPVITQVSISPDPASTADELSADVAVTDDEGDAIEGYTYEWFVNTVSVGTDATLAPGAAVRDDVVSVTVVASDMYGDSAAVSSADLTIGNAAPAIDSITITPDPATTNDSLTVSASTSDADSDAVTVSYEWFVNTNSIGTTDTLDSANFAKGDEVTVTVIADDGTDTTTSTSTALIVGNSAPTATIAIDQTSAVTTDTLSATYSSTDADLDALVSSIDWMVDGISTGISTDTLDSSNFSKGQSVSVQITVDDGTDTTVETSASLVIDNSDPTADSSIGPMAAVYGEDVVCALTNEDDADNDSITITETLWTFGSSATETTTGDTLALDVAIHGAETSVSCTPTFSDGESSVVGTSSVFVSITDLAVRHLAYGELIITELMQNPSVVNDDDGEWFEVWVNSSIDTTAIGGGNRGDINLYGLAIEDLGTDDFIIDMDYIVNTSDYIVFGINDDLSTNGNINIDYLYSGMSLGNGTDELVLLNESGVVIDEITWDNGSTFPDPTGASMSLDPGSIDADDNDNGATWCEATSSYGDGDLGTPGADNDVCSQP